MIDIHYWPVKNNRFFASLRMTGYYIPFVEDGDWLAASPPTNPQT